MKLTILTFLFSLFSVATLAQTPLWMRYPAISPDGSTIVFSYQGDLYTVSTAGGKAVPITTHEGHDYHPMWSSDGKTIAFASSRYGNFDVFSIPAAGGKAKRLTFHEADDFPSDFTPDNASVLFYSRRMPAVESANFPYGRFSYLYSIPVAGGQPEPSLHLPVEAVKVDASGNRMLYQDYKGYEDPWRKHHTSSVTRNIWLHDKTTGEHTRLTSFEGEDRNPLWNGNSFYYLSEESGTFNVWKKPLGQGQATRLTSFEPHPVRFLSKSDDNLLCFGYHGEIYTMKEGSAPRKVNITVRTDGKYNDRMVKVFTDDATEMALSPNGKEIAFIVRGEVFVTAVANNLTKRITNTPEQERSVSFSKDGRKLLYAGERNGSWNIYETSIVREEEPYFYAATVLEEETVLENESETFQPRYSPSGNEVAFLEERTRLKVLNRSTGEERTILPGNYNYSYSDGDQYYSWSPDGEWFLVQYIDNNKWIDEAGLVKADGSQEVINLTNSGYSDTRPKWQLNGKAMIWFTDRRGMRSHGSWGSQDDVFATFFNLEAWATFQLSEEEYKLRKEQQEGEEEGAEEPLEMNLENLEDRTARLTLHSSNLGDALLGPEGEKLYYLSSFEKGHDLWVTDLRSRETKVLAKLDKTGGTLAMDKEGNNLFILNDGTLYKIELKDDKASKERISFKAEMEWKPAQERAYIFKHMWRQVDDKFYVKDLHGLNWQALKNAYEPFLPHINNNFDFSEMMSELLGELNASHTGCRYYHNAENGDETAALGVFYDYDYTGAGIQIREVMLKSPLVPFDVRSGDVIEKVNGFEIGSNQNIYELLNRKADEYILLSLYRPETKKRQDIRVKPISQREQGNLLYERWVEGRKRETERISDSKIGYVHVRGMNDRSFRKVYSELLGRYADKESVVIDTRFNGGGWLHDDLVTFLDGTPYIQFSPRGQRNMGGEPQFKWSRPSVVLMGEGNYSDAHMFPYAYKALNVGETVGMPVPGTGTAVWWERQIDQTLVFGIPQVGMVDVNGNYLENQQLEPDYEVKNEYEELIKGRDQQLEKAVNVLEEEIEINLEKTK